MYILLYISIYMVHENSIKLWLRMCDLNSGVATSKGLKSYVELVGGLTN